jgi:hypothetical protein
VDISWILPLSVGAVLSLGTSLLTGAIQSGRERKREELARAESVKDRRFDRGREAATRALDDLTSLKRDTVDKGAPDNSAGHYPFDRALVNSLKRHAELVTRKSVRNPVVDVARMAYSLGPAEEELPDLRWKVERALLVHAESILTAYLRGDQTPADSVKFIASVKNHVETAWKEADERGEVYKD